MALWLQNKAENVYQCLVDFMILCKYLFEESIVLLLSVLHQDEELGDMFEVLLRLLIFEEGIVEDDWFQNLNIVFGALLVVHLVAQFE